MHREHRFKPAWWLKNPHLQTVYARFIGRNRQIESRQEIFELSDGDFLDCRWTGEGSGPILIILHGLEGSVESHYVKGIMAASEKLGWRSVLVHFRSCGEQLNRLAKNYHSGETNDIAEFVKSLRAREPQTPLMAVGYSLGGNVLLKWLGETGHQNPLTAAVAVSVPFDLKRVTEVLNKKFTWAYQQYFLVPLKEKLLKKSAIHEYPFDEETVRTIMSIRDYDERITAPMYGFKNAEDYYHQCSSRGFVKHVRVPTLLIQSEDDPFMGPGVIPHPHEVSEHVELEVYTHGGHVGFVSGWNPLKPKYWLEEKIPLYFQHQLEMFNNKGKVA